MGSLHPLADGGWSAPKYTLARSAKRCCLLSHDNGALVIVVRESSQGSFQVDLGGTVLGHWGFIVTRLGDNEGTFHSWANCQGVTSLNVEVTVAPGGSAGIFAGSFESGRRQHGGPVRPPKPTMVTKELMKLSLKVSTTKSAFWSFQHWQWPSLQTQKPILGLYKLRAAIPIAMDSD